MIHIVFQEADIEVLKKAMELDNSMEGKVAIFRDDYAVGPVDGIYEAEGYQQRREWWKHLLDMSPYDADQLMNMVDDRLAIHNLKKELDEDPRQDVWIWMGQNEHDVCGYYWLVSQLQPYHGRIYVLYLNNLPFINEKGQIFYPVNLSEIQPKEFLKAKKLNRKVTPSEFEVDPDEWKRLCQENATVRMLEGGKKIVGKAEDYFDNDILKVLTNEWQKGNKAIAAIQGKMKVRAGDVFLLWRIKELAAQDKLQLNGDTSKGWKDFEVKLRSETPAETPVAETNQAL